MDLRIHSAGVSLGDPPAPAVPAKLTLTALPDPHTLAAVTDVRTLAAIPVVHTLTALEE